MRVFLGLLFSALFIHSPAIADTPENIEFDPLVEVYFTIALEKTPTEVEDEIARLNLPAKVIFRKGSQFYLAWPREGEDKLGEIAVLRILFGDGKAICVTHASWILSPSWKLDQHHEKGVCPKN